MAELFSRSPEGRKEREIPHYRVDIFFVLTISGVGLNREPLVCGNDALNNLFIGEFWRIKLNTLSDIPMAYWRPSTLKRTGPMVVVL